MYKCIVFFIYVMYVYLKELLIKVYEIKKICFFIWLKIYKFNKGDGVKF